MITHKNKKELEKRIGAGAVRWLETEGKDCVDKYIKIVTRNNDATLDECLYYEMDRSLKVELNMRLGEYERRKEERREVLEELKMTFSDRQRKKIDERLTFLNHMLDYHQGRIGMAMLALNRLDVLFGKKGFMEGKTKSPSKDTSNVDVSGTTPAARLPVIIRNFSSKDYNNPHAAAEVWIDEMSEEGYGIHTILPQRIVDHYYDIFVVMEDIEMDTDILERFGLQIKQ